MGTQSDRPDPHIEALASIEPPPALANVHNELRLGMRTYQESIDLLRECLEQGDDAKCDLALAKMEESNRIIQDATAELQEAI